MLSVFDAPIPHAGCCWRTENRARKTILLYPARQVFDSWPSSGVRNYWANEAFLSQWAWFSSPAGVTGKLSSGHTLGALRFRLAFKSCTGGVATEMNGIYNFPLDLA